MVLNFKKTTITTLVENRKFQDLEQLKQKMLDEIGKRNQIRIITQIEGHSIEHINLINNVEGVNALFQPYGF
jgi:hypothetical protein